MAQLRHFQLFRNDAVCENLAAAKSLLASQINNLKDGEMALARYYTKPVSETADGDHNVHVVLGVVRVGSDSTLEKPVKSMDFIYCGSEVTNKINTAIAALNKDSETAGDGNVTVTYEETDGIVSITDVTVAYTTVTRTAKSGAHGTEGHAEPSLTVTDGGKIATGSDIEKVALYAKDYADDKIEQLDANVTSRDGTNVQVKVIEANGVITGVNVTTDNTVNSTDVANAIDAISGAGLAVSNTGAITATTQDASDNTTNVATTAFVKTAIDNLDTESAQTTSAISTSADNKTITITPYTLNEANGIVSTTAGNSVTLNINQEQSANNPIATMADVTATNLTGVDSITVNSTNHKVSLTIDSTDKVLTQSETGLLANISMRYDSTAKKIYLEGKGTTKAKISEIDATDFVKDGMITKVEVVETAEQGVTTEAPYLKITWNNDGPTPQISRVSLKNLVDVYTADETYLHMNDHKVEHKTSGVTASSYGESATATKGYAGTISIPRITVDAAGHVTAASNSVITLPSEQTAKDEIKLNVESNKATITDTFTLDGTAQEGTNVTITAEGGLKLDADGDNGAKIGHVASYNRIDDSTAVVVDGASESTTFKVPTLEIDSWGHVIKKQDQSITITLPASIDTAVQTVLGDTTTSDQRDNLENTEYINVKAVREANSNDVKLQSSIKTIAIEEASAGTDADGWRYIGNVGIIELQEGDIVECSRRRDDNMPNSNFDEITYTYGGGQNGTKTGYSFTFGADQDVDLATVDGADKGELEYAAKYVWMKGIDADKTSDILAKTVTYYQGHRIYRKSEETPENDGLATSLNVRNYINSHETQIIAGSNTTVTAAMDGDHTVYTINATGTPVVGGNGINVTPNAGNTANTVSVDLAENTTSGSTRTNTQASNLLIIDDDNKLSISDTWDCGCF